MEISSENPESPAVEVKTPFRWGALTDIGRVRQENQDAWLVNPELGLFIVTDGMGGHRGGAQAAGIVIEDLPVMIETGLHRLKHKNRRTLRRVIEKSLIEHSRHVRLEGSAERGRVDMGATVVVLLLQGGRGFIGSLGDSRIYRLRRGRLGQLTHDHSVVAEMVAQQQIAPAEAEDHPDRNQITQYAGMEETAQPHIRCFGLQAGDVFLLCSDGLTDMVNDRQLARILRDQPDPQRAAQTLINKANTAGGQDNITAVVVAWEG